MVISKKVHVPFLLFCFCCILAYFWYNEIAGRIALTKDLELELTLPAFGFGQKQKTSLEGRLLPTMNGVL